MDAYSYLGFTESDMKKYNPYVVLSLTALIYSFLLAITK
jgi:hypothetical protein